MKTIKIKAISAVIFLGATVLYGAGNESLYMGNVGRINPSISQILIGEVQVSGIQSPTKLRSTSKIVEWEKKKRAKRIKNVLQCPMC